jgi:hypothetical protein
MGRDASGAAKRLDVLEAEVARLRQVIEERLASPVSPNGEVESLIPVTEAARMAKVTPQSIRNWIDLHGIGRFVAPVYLVDRRLLRDHLIRRGGKLPPELIRG